MTMPTRIEAPLAAPELPRETTIASAGSAARKIARNAASILVSDAAGEAVTAYAIGLAAIHLGPVGFGALSEAQAFLDPIAAFASFGLTPLAITFAAQRRGADASLRGTIEGLRIGFGAIGGLAAIVLAVATGRSEMVPVLLVLAAGLVVLSYWNALMVPFQVDQSMHRLIAMPFLASLVRLGTAYLAVHLMCTAVGFQLSGLAGGLATAVLFAWAAHRFYPARRRFDRDLARRIVSGGWPVALEAGLAMLYARGAYSPTAATAR
jgi:O-antigen/teichoic acid export membrane protein